MARIQFLVHGTVQGVNFRSFTQKKASSYGLTGFVRNTDNEKVQGEAQGTEDNIQKLLKDINEGPTHAHVVKLEHDSIDEKSGESSFETSSMIQCGPYTTGGVLCNSRDYVREAWLCGGQLARFAEQ